MSRIWERAASGTARYCANHRQKASRLGRSAAAHRPKGLEPSFYCSPPLPSHFRFTSSSSTRAVELLFVTAAHWRDQHRGHNKSVSAYTGRVNNSSSEILTLIRRCDGNSRSASSASSLYVPLLPQWRRRSYYRTRGEKRWFVQSHIVSGRGRHAFFMDVQVFWHDSAGYPPMNG